MKAIISDKREAILNATLELINKHGFHASPMSMVAKEAGVAAGTIYHYFESKEELINALYLNHKEKLLKISLIQDDTSKPYKERFRHFFYALFEFYVKNPKEFMFAEQYKKSPFYQQVPKDKIAEFEQPILDFLKKGVFTRQFKDIPPKLMLTLILSFISSMAVLDINREMIIDYTVLDVILNVCWDGLKYS